MSEHEPHDDRESEDQRASEDERADGTNEVTGERGAENTGPKGPDDGRRGSRNWWWLAGGVIGAILLLTVLRPMISPFRSPGPSLPSPGIPPVTPAPAGSNLKVIGFFDETTEQTTPKATDLVAANRDKIDYFAPLWYKIESDGSLSSRKGTDSQRLINQTKIPTIPRYATSGSESVVKDAAVRAKAVGNIVADVTKNQWAGCSIDSQSLSASARDGLTAFMTELRAKLPPGKLIILSVKPPGSSTVKSNPYNYSELIKHVDQMVLLAHDKHTAGTSPGPVAPLTWVEDSIKAVLAQGVPANKLWLGIATYGYDWKTGTKAGATLMPMKKIPLEKADTHPFDIKNQSAFHTYTDSAGVKHEMWWEDEKSLGTKVDLARRHGLHGIAICRVGYEDEKWWTTLGTLLKR